MWAELHRPSGKDVAVLGAPHGVGFVEPDAAGLTERATEIVRRTEHRGRAEAVLTFTLQGCKAELALGLLSDLYANRPTRPTGFG